MADKWTSDRNKDERTAGVGDEEIRGVADVADEFEDADDLDEEEDDEEGTTF